ncbi:MAG: hemolysin III family protein [Clostridia bacterium]
MVKSKHKTNIIKKEKSTNSNKCIVNKKNERILSIGEEIANAITHGVGAIGAIVALIVMIIAAVLYGNVWQVVSVSIYGTTLVILYTMSTLYHSLAHTKARRVFQIFDHASIYLLIAGTYTPFTLVTLRQDGAVGWTIFSIVWAMALIGIVSSTLSIDKFKGKFKVIKTAMYIIMGWAIVFAIPDIAKFIQPLGVFWLAAGGILYTLGTIFYLNKHIKYFHSIWHIFVLMGSICHFISIMFYVL